MGVWGRGINLARFQRLNGTGPFPNTTEVTRTQESVFVMTGGALHCQVCRKLCHTMLAITQETGSATLCNKSATLRFRAKVTGWHISKIETKCDFAALLLSYWWYKQHLRW